MKKLINYDFISSLKSKFSGNIFFLRWDPVFSSNFGRSKSTSSGSATLLKRKMIWDISEDGNQYQNIDLKAWWKSQVIFFTFLVPFYCGAYAAEAPKKAP